PVAGTNASAPSLPSVVPVASRSGAEAHATTRMANRNTCTARDSPMRRFAPMSYLRNGELVKDAYAQRLRTNRHIATYKQSIPEFEHFSELRVCLQGLSGGSAANQDHAIVAIARH